VSRAARADHDAPALASCRAAWCEVQRAGPVVADPIEADSSFRTSVPGLLAAGDVTGEMPSVARAIGAGHSAAAMSVQDLMAEAHGLTQTGSGTARLVTRDNPGAADLVGRQLPGPAERLRSRSVAAAAEVV
jgi:hypothetical protein